MNKREIELEKILIEFDQRNRIENGEKQFNI